MYKNYFLTLLTILTVAGTAAPVFASDNSTNTVSEDSQTEVPTPPVEPEQPTEPEKPENPQPEEPVTPPVEPEKPETPSVDEPIMPNVPKDDAAVGGGSQNNGPSQPSIGTITVGTGNKEEIPAVNAGKVQSEAGDSNTAQAGNTTSKPAQSQTIASTAQDESSVSEENGEAEPDTSDESEIAVPLTGELSAVASRTNQAAVTVLLIVGALALSAGVTVMMADKLKKD